MYRNDFIFTRNFQDRFYRLKNNPNPKDTFTLMKDYVILVETGYCTKKSLQNTNPLSVDKNTQLFIREFNAFCLEFLIKMASLLGNKKLSSEAHVFLGLTYELGLFGISKNQRNSFNYYIVAAKQNNKYGTYRLAQAYEKEFLSSEGHSRAIYFYRCAAKLGCIYGMHTYGSILLRGDLGSVKDFDTGLFYMKLASQKASESYPYPFYDLGQIYESQNSCYEVDADDDYAFKMYERGASLGCPNSLHKLGKCFETGQLFRTANMKLAIEYYEKASDNGHMDAQYLMSKFLFTGVEGVLNKNINQSFTYALQSAIRGHPEGACAVAEFIEKGYGVKNNNLLSLWWYTISSNMGNKKADLKMTELKGKIYRINMGPSHRPKGLCCFC